MRREYGGEGRRWEPEGEVKGNVVDHMAEMLQKREAPLLKAGIESMAPFQHKQYEWPLVKDALCVKSQEKWKISPCKAANQTGILTRG